VVPRDRYEGTQSKIEGEEADGRVKTISLSASGEYGLKGSELGQDVGMSAAVARQLRAQQEETVLPSQQPPQQKKQPPNGMGEGGVGEGGAGGGVSDAGRATQGICDQGGGRGLDSGVGVELRRGSIDVVEEAWHDDVDGDWVGGWKPLCGPQTDLQEKRETTRQGSEEVGQVGHVVKEATRAVELDRGGRGGSRSVGGGIELSSGDLGQAGSGRRERNETEVSAETSVTAERMEGVEEEVEEGEEEVEEGEEERLTRRLYAYYGHFNLSKIQEVPRIAEVFVQDLRTLDQMLTAKYGTSLGEFEAQALQQEQDQPTAAAAASTGTQ